MIDWLIDNRYLFGFNQPRRKNMFGSNGDENKNKIEELEEKVEALENKIANIMDVLQMQDEFDVGEDTDEDVEDDDRD